MFWFWSWTTCRGPKQTNTVQRSGRACSAQQPAEQQPHGLMHSTPAGALQPQGRSSWWDVCWQRHSDIWSSISRCLKKPQRKDVTNHSCSYEEAFPEQINCQWAAGQSVNRSPGLLLSRPWAETMRSHHGPKTPSHYLPVYHHQVANEEQFHSRVMLSTSRLSGALSHNRFFW